MGRSYTNGKPRVYAREKLPMLRGRNAELMALLNHDVPVVFPEGDAAFLAAAFLGFTSFSDGWTENTTEGVLTQPFHEVGLFQVPAGARSGPAPNTAGNAAYSALAASEPVKRCLGGRAATTAPNGWKAAHADQVAVGIANLRRDEATLRAMLPTGLAGDARGWSYWRVATMFTAFSRGPGQAKAVLMPFAAELARTDEARRWRKFRELVVQAIGSGATGIGARQGKMGAAYAIVRTEQKLESGVLAAQQLGLAGAGGFTERYVSPGDDPAEDAIARCAYGVSAVSVAQAAVETAANVATIATDAASTGGGKVVLGVLSALAVGGGGIALYRSGK